MVVVASGAAVGWHFTLRALPKTGKAREACSPAIGNTIKAGARDHPWVYTSAQSIPVPSAICARSAAASWTGGRQPICSQT